MNTRILTTTAVATILAFGATSAFAAKSAQDFVKDAVQGDNSEIMLGQLAQQKGGSDQTKQFGQMLVTDHTQAKDQVVALAKTLGVSPPDGAMPEAQTEQTKLSKLSGAGFDKEFADYMVNDHRKDIQEFQEQSSANNGAASDLAAKQLPVLQKHLAMAQKLAANDQSSAASTGAASAVANAPQSAANDWRASKLAGVAVYGPDNKKVGDITDVMMSRDGKAELVIIGVGGFLGIGEKDVAVPFDQVKFTDQPVVSSAANSNSSAMNGGTTTGAAAGGNTLGSGGTNPGTAAPGVNSMVTGRAADDSTSEARSTMMGRSAAYPDHGTIEMTADQLKNAPDFKFVK